MSVIMSVPDVILNQLGGSLFLTITNCQVLMASKNSITLKIPKNKSKANRFSINIQSNELFTVCFLKYVSSRKKKNSNEYSNEKLEIVESFYDVSLDKLKSIFKQVTGLYTPDFSLL